MCSLLDTKNTDIIKVVLHIIIEWHMVAARYTK
jgi:hypothetical protein